MELVQILTQTRTLCRLNLGDKHAAITSISELIANDLPAFDAAALTAALTARERLGSTGLGDGIAIPHCRIKTASTLVGALITLAEPIEFDAIDDEPVDILFALIAPENAAQTHLNALATLASRLSQPEYRRRLRNAETAADLFNAALASLS